MSEVPEGCLAMFRIIAGRLKVGFVSGAHPVGMSSSHFETRSAKFAGAEMEWNTTSSAESQVVVTAIELLERACCRHASEQ